MTLQEIDRIECAIRHIESSLDVDPWADEIAVEALKAQEQLANNSPELANNFGDLISRKAAIDAVRSDYEGILDFTSDGHTIADSVEDILSELPSAQSEPCEDAVSRQRLLSDLKELTAAWGKYPVMEEQIKGVEMAIGYVETIPSVTRERENGKWIVVDDAYNRISGKCSVCGWEAHMYEDDVVGMDYCPNCGARMEDKE